MASKCLLTFRRNTPTGVGKTVAALVVSLKRRKHPHGRGEDGCAKTCASEIRETPPRAWGRLALGKAAPSCIGNTPTGVGKTAPTGFKLAPTWKHPHGRGEDEGRRQLVGGYLETPPRAWGRPRLLPTVRGFLGNTPTGVGKTLYQHTSARSRRKHPHGRGEDIRARVNALTARETPPRAWGRPMSNSSKPRCIRNTPTGVGKTIHYFFCHRRRLKHPHGRGED